ncbi:MAG: conserved repeat domain [Phycisphaerales bacterium]|nr:conserved repeat domain [Phycisphaerales bacterium]
MREANRRRVPSRSLRSAQTPRPAGPARAEHLESRRLLTAAISFDSVPRGYGAADYNPTAGVVGDFNADGIPDLVVTDDRQRYPGDQDLRILLGNGDGNFHLGGSAVVGHGARQLAVGDFNNDHKLDVLATDTADSRLAIFLGNGNGTLGPVLYMPLGGDYQPGTMAVGDFNRDGAADFAIGDPASPTRVFLGDGAGSFTLLVNAGSENGGFLLPSFQGVLVTDDVNGDGKLDLISGDVGPARLRVMLGRGDGSFAAALTSNLTTTLSGVAIADVNGDGRKDLVMSEGNLQEWHGAVRLGNGDGTFGPETLLAVPDEPSGVAIADFDLDFKLDIAFGTSAVATLTPTQNVYFFHGDGRGGFGPAQARYISGDSPEGLVSADFNRDGRPDVAVSLYKSNYTYALVNTAVFQNSIRGVVFNDDNKNGVHDPAETFVAGRTIYVDANSNGGLDAGEQSTTTATDGTYDLSVPNGSYAIRQVLPAGWIQTSPTGAPGSALPAFNVTATGHSIRAGVDFGTYFRGTISGTLYNDSNASGVREAYEDATIPGGQRTVYVDANDNGQLDAGEITALTDALGGYRFILPPGTYRIREVLPGGWFQTAPANAGGKSGAYLITVGVGQAVTDRDFGSTQLGGISGRVFYDLTADGISADSDPGRAGFAVYIDSNFNGSYDGNESYTFTDNTGHYSFSNLFPGNYAVGVIKPAGWVQTTPATPLGTFKTPVFGGGGSVGGYVDFGVIFPSYVTGRVFNDLNGDGNQTAGENGLAGFGVFVDVSNTGYGSFSDPATQTDTQGNYTLRVPVDGTYNVRVTRPSGWQSTVPSSNARSVVFSNGSTVTGQNFGLKQGAFNNAGFMTPVNFPASQFSFVNPASVATGDFNLDNKQDFVVANNSGDVTLYLGNGLGGFTRSSVGFGGSGKRTVITAFLNADNKPDLITANQEDGTVSVFLANGNGTFQNNIDYPAAAGAYCVVAADFTGDGKIDLAVGGISGAQVVLLTGNGLGGFGAPISIGPSAGTYAIATGDFNNDNKKDLAWVNQFTNNVIVVRSNGNGTFQAPITITTGINQPGSIALGDFNKDNFLDMAVLNLFSDVVRVFNGLGNGTFNAGVNYGTGSTPSQVTTMDVDGDGWTDLAIAYKSDGTTNISGGVNILRNHADGTFEAALTCTGHTSPNSVATADFNGDGLADVVATNFYSDDVSVMINNRSPSVMISGVVFDDANGDGIKAASEGFLAGRGVFIDIDNDGALDPGEPIATTNAAGQFVFPPLPAGAYVVRLVPDPAWSQTLPAAGAGQSLTLAAGSSASLTFGLHDIQPPAVFAADFLFNAPAMTLRFAFDENVGTSLTAADFQLTNLTTGQTVPAANITLNYVAGSFVASVTFPNYSHGTLPDGDYRITLAAGSFADASGNLSANASGLDFFVLAADANHDRSVDFLDLAALAQNYNTTSKTFPQGDFNYDGNVDFLDLALLAQRYNTTLALPGAPAPLPSASVSFSADWAAAVAKSAPLPPPPPAVAKPKVKPKPIFNTQRPIKLPPKPVPKHKASAH